jgi:hypothetical protein
MQDLLITLWSDPATAVWITRHDAAVWFSGSTSNLCRGSPVTSSDTHSAQHQPDGWSNAANSAPMRTQKEEELAESIHRHSLTHTVDQFVCDAHSEERGFRQHSADSCVSDRCPPSGIEAESNDYDAFWCPVVSRFAIPVNFSHLMPEAMPESWRELHGDQKRCSQNVMDILTLWLMPGGSGVNAQAVTWIASGLKL